MYYKLEKNIYNLMLSANVKLLSHLKQKIP